MKKILFCLLFVFSFLSIMVQAEESRRIFTHISSDSAHRVQKALGYTANQMDRGVIVAVWADDRAVIALSQKNKDSFIKEQALIARLIKGNVTVAACPFSMKNYGINAEDLLPGVQVGSFDLVDPLLFAPGVRTLNW